MSKDKTADIGDLDGNLAPREVRSDVEWYDAAALDVEGQGWADVQDRFDRLPARAKGVVREPVWNLSRHSSGLSVRFVTDARTIAARWTIRQPVCVMHHMANTGISGLDLYTRCDGLWRWIGTGVPGGAAENESPLLKGSLDGEAREYRLYLPLYNGLTTLELGLPKGARLTAVELDRRKPICFYGTSIVQGGCASRPGMAYPAILSRRLDRPAINLGFSGNGCAEPELADLLAEIDAAAFVLDPLPNLQPGQVAERLGNMVRVLRSARPATPIVLIENITYRDCPLVAEHVARATGSNEALRDVHSRLVADDIGGLHYVHGDALLGENDNEATVDGAHPTDLGFHRMADAIEPTLRQAMGV